MKIILGSTNQSKKNSISIALESLGIYDYEIECIAVPSNVSSKPLNDDTLKGQEIEIEIYWNIYIKIV